MEKEKNNSGLIALLIVLFLLVLGLGGYIVYDKVLRNKETPVEKNTSDSDNIENTISENNEEKNNTTTANIEEKKENNNNTIIPDYCSYEMIPYLEALFNHTVEYNNGKPYLDFTKYNAKDETLIKRFLDSYLMLSAIKNGFGAVIGENEIVTDYSLNISKSTLDSITKTVFNTNGLKDYTYLYRGQLGISKINDIYYKISWAATGGSRVHLYDVSMNSKDNKHYITASAKMGSDGGDIGNIGKTKVTISINNDNSCYIEKIEKIG